MFWGPFFLCFPREIDRGWEYGIGAGIANGAATYRSANLQPPQECSGECSGRCRPETGCSGKCLEKCLSSLFLEETPGTSTSPFTSPSTPFLAGTSPSTLPSTSGGLEVLRWNAALCQYMRTAASRLEQKKHIKKNTHIKNRRGPEHKDLRALILYVGGPLLLYFPGKEPPHKEFLGWDPNRGISGAFLYVYVLLSGSHRLTRIASDFASRALASQAKLQRESESQAFRIARSLQTCRFFASQPNIAGFSQGFFCYFLVTSDQANGFSHR